MKIQGAVIEEQGISFAVVKVEKDVFEVPGRARDKMVELQPLFPQMSIIFMTGEPGESVNFYGRPDIVRVMMKKSLDDIVWKEYALEEPAGEG